MIPVSSVVGKWQLRSADSGTLVAASTRTTVGWRDFAMSGPATNSLQRHGRASPPNCGLRPCRSTLLRRNSRRVCWNCQRLRGLCLIGAILTNEFNYIQNVRVLWLECCCSACSAGCDVHHCCCRSHCLYNSHLHWLPLSPTVWPVKLIDSTPWVKKVHHRAFVITSPSTDRLSKFFHWHTLSVAYFLWFTVCTSVYYSNSVSIVVS